MSIQTGERTNIRTGRMLFLHALSPVHPGTGQAGAIVDLPIAREKATGWPIFPASGLKGVLRDNMSDGSNDAWIRRAFGPPPEDASDHAGGLHFTDQRVLAFPVRSFFGTFAFVTSPLVLRRFLRDYQAVGAAPPFPGRLPTVGELEALVPSDHVLGPQGKVYLEDLDLEAKPSEEAALIADGLAGVLFQRGEHEVFRKRFALVSDTVFDFLCETATEVTARVRLKDDTKTVETGGLWYEEAVPAEAIFYGAVVVAPHLRAQASDLLQPFDEADGRLVQIGGQASVGRGLCRLIVRG